MTAFTAQPVYIMYMTVVTGEEIVSIVLFCFYASYSTDRLLLRWFSDGWAGSSTGLDQGRIQDLAMGGQDL